jgi:hypothetical protein
MRTDPFPPWPSHLKPLLTKLEQLKETEFHTLSFQHFTLTSLNDNGTKVKITHHDYDIVKPKADCPPSLKGNEDWERVLSDPVDLGGLKYKRVVRVDYRHKATGIIVRRLPDIIFLDTHDEMADGQKSRENVTWQPSVFPGGMSIPSLKNVQHTH